MSTDSNELHQVQFNNYLVEFIKKLKIVFPNDKQQFSKYYKYYRQQVDDNHRIEFIAEFIQLIQKYNKEVTTCDECLFSEDTGYYPHENIYLLKNIDFKPLWRTESLDNISKTNIWKYFHTLIILGNYVLNESTQYKTLLQAQKQIVHDLIQSMKYEQKIKHDAHSSSQSDFDFSKIGDLFNENNLMTQIIKEVLQETDIRQEFGNNPLQALGLLCGQNNTKLESIITKLVSKVTSILKEKGLSEQDLYKEAQSLLDKILDLIPNNKSIPNLEQLKLNIKKELGNVVPENEKLTDEQRLSRCQTMIQQLTQNLKDNLLQIGMDNNNIQATLDKVIKENK